MKEQRWKSLVCVDTVDSDVGILKAEDRSVWVGKVKKLFLDEYAMEILPKLRLCEDNVMEKLRLYANDAGQISRILGVDDRSIWMGKVKGLCLGVYAIEILPKLRFCEETEIEKFGLCAETQENIAGILRKENQSIWVGRVKKLRLYGHALQILPKLRIHGGGRIESLLKTHSLERVAEILRARRNNDWRKKHEKKPDYIYARILDGGVFEFKFR
ncbi:MAG: uncharacterized protein A8A55_0696 [Amphiamblys sp. WSBS2006]|nr:MAG: uncharacterized protein A8A55_0696 [Amphiamblys sp. WSBS2006]